MLSDILAQYDSVTEKLAELKAEGKEKTVGTIKALSK